jgi:type I restriction-modification system DNA methylase subunit
LPSCARYSAGRTRPRAATQDYILPLIFLKRLSDVFDDEVEHLAQDFGNQTTAAKLVKQDHKLVRFYVPEKARWAKIATTTTGLGQVHYGMPCAPSPARTRGFPASST